MSARLGAPACLLLLLGLAGGASALCRAALLRPAPLRSSRTLEPGSSLEPTHQRGSLSLPPERSTAATMIEGGHSPAGGPPEERTLGEGGGAMTHPLLTLLRPHTREGCRANSAVMLEGGPPPEPTVEEEVFGAMVDQLGTLDKVLKRMPSLALGASANSLIALSAVVAWIITPSRVPTIVTVGVAGAAGKRVGDSLKQKRRETVPAAIAEMILESGIKDLSLVKVEELAKKFDVPADDFDAALRKVYGQFLGAVAEDEDVEAAQVTKLAALRRNLGLKWNVTEAVHEQKAKEFIGGDEPPQADAMPSRLSKLLWASMSLFATSKGRAKGDGLVETLGLTQAQASGVINELSAPLYKSALGQALARYNRTEMPTVLQTVRRALNLTEEAAQAVHNDVYDSQLKLILPDGSRTAVFDEEAKELLSELEGGLQIRSAAQRVQARTVPLYRLAAAELLTQPTSLSNPNAAWAELAVRQRGLALGTDRAKAVLQEEARRIATEKLNAAATLMAQGKEEEAVAAMEDVVGFSDLVGSMVKLGGWLGDKPVRDLASRYLGALSIEPSLDDVAQRLLAAAVDKTRGRTSADKLSQAEPLLQSMLALGTPGLKKAKDNYVERIEALIASKAFDENARQALNAAGTALGLPEPLQRKLALDAYYGWLLDITEGLSSARTEAAASMASGAAPTKPRELLALERSAELRQCLELAPSAVGELYSNTDIDGSVLRAYYDYLNPASAYEVTDSLSYLERVLDARPGIVAQILASS
mmetsp:Transcript_1574/g.4005  ORF Transcript_1574/g.4005 Transcript_1574/m.4005 type:complete len:762 (+) Transcript_1574:39-2324(+)